MAGQTRISTSDPKGAKGLTWEGVVGCHQLCATNPIFAVLGLKMRVERKNEANRSQFGPWGSAAGGDALLCAKQSQISPFMA